MGIVEISKIMHAHSVVLKHRKDGIDIVPVA